jgi:hypothetical protein
MSAARSPRGPRDYLLDRFRADADALRQRVAALRAGRPAPGPDAATSERMAAACEEVAAMLAALPESRDADAALAALDALVPLLEQRAGREAKAPAVRAVYAGAATRIREVGAAERRAATQPEETGE